VGRTGRLDDSRSGVLLLAYRILAILPVIAGAIELYRAMWTHDPLATDEDAKA
jgi:hypothetical protein